MKSSELRTKFLEYFKKNGHEIIPSASLVPENDPTVLFTTAGMHPLVPFLLGEKHPAGKRLVSCQKCIRTVDIDDVGDDTHNTFFEMLGNWSLGDYWKEEAINWSFEFLTKELKIPLERLAISCFAGDKDAPKDEESAKIWESLGIKKERIDFLPKEDNWWGPAGKTGPCGPDTEVFYWKLNNTPVPEKFDAKDKNWVEIWNAGVFMEYIKDENGNYNLAQQKNVDTGMGLERTIAILNGKENVYETDLFSPIIEEIEKISGKKYITNERPMRIIADHIKASVFLIAEGITPSNVGRGYILRRLIRRAVRYGRFIEIENFTKQIIGPIFYIYKNYPDLQDKKSKIISELEKEEKAFLEKLDQGLKQAEKIFSSKKPINPGKFNELMANPNKGDLIGRVFDKKRNGVDYSLKDPKLSKEEIDGAEINGQEAFLLFQSYGFPLEMIDELAMAKGFLVSHEDFRIEQKKHQELSRTASAGMFKGGLADASLETTKLHTAAHLMLAGLRKVLGGDVYQKGSNITSERLRFDFSYKEKLSSEQLKDVENFVNDIIKKDLPVWFEEMSLEKAKEINAMGVFESKYGDRVKVYFIGKGIENISKEICGGPHVERTGILGHFKIQKEESSSSGVRRIKAILSSQ